MLIENKEKDRLRLECEAGQPVIKMESKGIRMTFCFATEPPETDAKKMIVDILTSRYIFKTTC